MMRLKVKRIGRAMHPSEVLVSALASDGREVQVVVDEASLSEDGLEIGWPIRRLADTYLVELPKEAVSGAWRLWVDKNEVRGDLAEAG